MNSILLNDEYTSCRVAINWDTVEGKKLAAGTPISADGLVANNERAIGLILHDIAYEAYPQPADVVVDGIVDTSEAEARFGSTYSYEARLAMSGLVFVGAPGGGVPPVTGNGKVLVSVAGEWVEQDGYGYIVEDAAGVQTYHRFDAQYIPIAENGGLVINEDGEIALADEFLALITPDAGGEPEPEPGDGENEPEE